MNTEKSVRQIVAEWNARAKAEGRLLEQDPWSLPPLYNGSVLDVPFTPEAEERIRHLDVLLARLEPASAAAVSDQQLDVRGRVAPSVGEASPTPPGSMPESIQRR